MKFQMTQPLLKVLKNTPYLGPFLVKLKGNVIGGIPLVFENSAQYWQDRYKLGGTSGAGSYGRLAQFKADFLNNFVRENAIQTVVEYGCGDGAQLSLAQYPSYTGFDVSSLAVVNCRRRFAKKTVNYQFFETSTALLEEGSFDLALSLDVIYHLIEDEVFDDYMTRLFRSSRRFVIIYAYNFEKLYESKHERGREFLSWCDRHVKDWKLLHTEKNPFPYDVNNPTETSQSDFFVFVRHNQPPPVTAN